MASNSKTSSKSPDDYYQILEIPRHATNEEIKRAYHKLALKYHPDKNPSSEAKEQFQKIKKAYEVLSNPRTREAYDRFGHQAAEAMHQYQEYPNRFVELNGWQKCFLGLFCCSTCCFCFGGCCCFCGCFCCCNYCCDHCCHHCCHPSHSRTRVHHSMDPSDSPINSQPKSSRDDRY